MQEALLAIVMAADHRASSDQVDSLESEKMRQNKYLERAGERMRASAALGTCHCCAAMLWPGRSKPHAGVWIVSRVKSPNIEAVLPVPDFPVTPPAED